MVGLHLLKHIKGLSDESVCEAWRENLYFQYFCGEEYFCHDFLIERSGMSHFRERVGVEALEILLQESLAAKQSVALSTIDRWYLAPIPFSSRDTRNI